jgi:hypothetical protein
MRVVHVELAWFSALAEGEQCPAPLAKTLALAIPALSTKRQHIADDQSGAQEGIAEAQRASGNQFARARGNGSSAKIRTRKLWPIRNQRTRSSVGDQECAPCKRKTTAQPRTRQA